MPSVVANITGSEELQRSLTAKGDAVREGVRLVLRALAEETRLRAQAGAPRRSGRLARSIRIRMRSEPGKLTARIAPGYLGHFYELGVPDQTVEVRDYFRRVRSGDVRGLMPTKTGKMRRRIIGHGIGHVTGKPRAFHITARPFMNPAAPSQETVRAQVAAAVQEGLR